jgi:hypothetical protein
MLTLTNILTAKGVEPIWLVQDNSRKIHFWSGCVQVPSIVQSQQLCRHECDKVLYEVQKNADQFCKHCLEGITAVADLWSVKPTASIEAVAAVPVDGKRFELESRINELELENRRLRDELIGLRSYADMLIITDAYLFSDLNKMEAKFAAPSGMLF